MAIQLLDGSLIVEIDFDKDDCEFEDNICLTFYESCPVDEKIMLAGETHIFLTAGQARQLAACLMKSVEASESARQAANGQDQDARREHSNG